MVQIKVLFFLIFVSLVTNSFASKRITVIRDAEIEFFLLKLIKNITDDTLKKNKLFYPRLILNNDYNAFVTGSNIIYVNTGLIQKSKSLSEIQGVLAHEIGHLVLNHHSSRLINANNLSHYSKFATIAGAVLSIGKKIDSNTAFGLIVGGQDLSTKSYLQFSRIQEQQADKFALDIMRKKKIPYIGLERLLINLSNDERTSNNSLSKYYRSHPFSKVRLEQLKKFKSKMDSSFEEKHYVLIKDIKITLKYIKNKIYAFNSNPFETLKKKDNNNNFLSNYSKIIAYKRIGKFDLAIKNLKKLESKFKNYPFYHELLGDIYFEKGEFNKAIKNYEKAILTIDDKFNGSDNIIKLSLVQSYLKTNKIFNINKSINILEKIIHYNPKWSYLWRLLAKASGKINKKGISFIALAEESMIKKNFIKAKKYVDLAIKYPTIPNSYRLRGRDILNRIKKNK